jgi:AraC-like DNA-binding protein
VRRRLSISLSATTGLLEAIETAGGNPEQVVRAAGLSRATMSKPDGFIPCARFARLLDEAARVTRDDCFGLHFGERFNPKDVGPLAYVLINSPTIETGLQNAARYLRVHNQAAKVSFGVDGRFAYARHVLADPAIEAPRQHNEYSMAVALNMIRLMAGSGWAPVEAQFAHPAPAQHSEHVRVFGAPVSFGHAANAFVIEREFLDRQVPAADPRLYPILRRYLDKVLAEVPPEDDLLASVRRAVAESMRQGGPSLTKVGKRVAMGPRTLQRRLKDHGIEFKALVDETRRLFALAYLRDPGQTLVEIAYLLGYSEVSAFNRAFRRWTGSTPSAYRRRITRQERDRSSGFVRPDVGRLLPPPEQAQ